MLSSLHPHQQTPPLCTPTNKAPSPPIAYALPFTSILVRRRVCDLVAVTRLMTYSKRHKGLFKKAFELHQLCSARAVIVVFSLAGKPCI
ncbi:hypothetical protein NL676_011479 [Syzygium grande]|nr:hypothetical protein NL676_011479 [Syzygium grande]